MGERNQDEPDLPGLAECQALGLNQVPVGFADLTARQAKFVLAYLRTGTGTEAARAAGYSSPESDGSKQLHHPKVAAVLAQAALPLAKDADHLIKRAANRSLVLHNLFVTAVNKPEGLRSSAEILRLESACNRADSLLGSLLGKIIGISVSGGNTRTDTSGPADTALPATFLPVLAQMRREVALATGARN